MNNLEVYKRVNSSRGDNKRVMFRPVSEFMSQKLDLITLHGMVKEEGVTEGARRATGVSPSPAGTKGEYHECDQRDKSVKPILL